MIRWTLKFNYGSHIELYTNDTDVKNEEILYLYDTEENAKSASMKWSEKNRPTPVRIQVREIGYTYRESNF